MRHRHFYYIPAFICRLSVRCKQIYFPQVYGFHSLNEPFRSLNKSGKKSLEACLVPRKYVNARKYRKLPWWSTLNLVETRLINIEGPNSFFERFLIRHSNKVGHLFFCNARFLNSKIQVNVRAYTVLLNAFIFMDW